MDKMPGSTGRKLSIVVDDTTWESLKIKAIKTRTTVSAIVRAALEFATTHDMPIKPTFKKRYGDM